MMSDECGMRNEIPAEAGPRDEAAVLRQVAEWDGLLEDWMRAAIFAAAERVGNCGLRIADCGLGSEEQPPTPLSPVETEAYQGVETEANRFLRRAVDGIKMGPRLRGDDGDGVPPEARITTVTGRQMNPLALRVEDVDVLDIRHALSMTCRFNGHTSQFYSVAEHSVRVSWWLEDMGHGAMVCLQGLMHDAGETYLHDVVKPLKGFYFVNGLPFHTIEDRVLRTVFEALDVDWPMEPAVHEADGALLRCEQSELMPEATRTRTTWSHEIAKKNFLARYVELKRALVKKGADR